MKRCLKLFLMALTLTHLAYAQQLIGDPEFDGGVLGVTAWGVAVGGGSTFATNLPTAAPAGTVLSRISTPGVVSGNLSTRTNASLVAGQAYVFSVVVSTNEVLSTTGAFGLQIRNLSNVVLDSQSFNLVGTQPSGQVLAMTWTATVNTAVNLLITPSGSNGGSTLAWTLSSASFRRVPELNAVGALQVLLLVGLAVLVARDRRRFVSGSVV